MKYKGKIESDLDLVTKKYVDDKVKPNYIELNSSSGTLTDEQYDKLINENAYIKNAGSSFYLYASNNTSLIYVSIFTAGGSIINSVTIIKATKYFNITMSQLQDKLVSGQTIKTINNQSLLGFGNIKITTTNSFIELTSISGSLTDEQINKLVNDKANIKLGDDYFYLIRGDDSVLVYINNITSKTESTTSSIYVNVDSKTYNTHDFSYQKLLTSGTNIKTINNESLLGRGNIDIQGGISDNDSLIKILRCRYYDSNSKVYDSNNQEVNSTYIADACLSSQYKTFIRFYETEDLYYVIPFIKYIGPKGTDLVPYPDGDYTFIFEGEYSVEKENGAIEHQIKRIVINTTRNNEVWQDFLVELIKDSQGNPFIWHSMGDDYGQSQKIDIQEGNAIYIEKVNADLPNEYERLDYIKASNNTCYFTLNYTATQDTKVEMVVKMDHATTYTSFVFGSNESYKRFNCVFGQSSGYSIRYEASATCPNITLNTLFDKTRIYISKEKREILDLENGAVISQDNVAGDFSTTKAMYIGSVSNDTTANTIKWSGRIYSFKLWDNDNLLYDYVPVRRKSDNMCGLFNMVDNTFLSDHLGSGVYNPGAVVDTGIKKLNVKVDNQTIKINENNELYVDINYLNTLLIRE